MKLNKHFVIHDAGDECLLVPMEGAGFSGIVRGNKMLGEVLRLLSDDTTEQEISESLRKNYSAPEGVIESDVKRTVSELKGIGAIVD